MRYAAVILRVLGALGFGLALAPTSSVIVPFTLCALLTLLGRWDLLQGRHSLRRDYWQMADAGSFKAQPQKKPLQ